MNANGTLDPTFQKSTNADGATLLWLLPDDTFLRTETKAFYDTHKEEILRHLDKDGNMLSEQTIYCYTDQVVQVRDDKVILAGNFFEPYDFVLLMLDPYAADSEPIKEVILK